MRSCWWGRDAKFTLLESADDSFELLQSHDGDIYRKLGTLTCPLEDALEVVAALEFLHAAQHAAVLQEEASLRFQAWEKETDAQEL